MKLLRGLAASIADAFRRFLLPLLRSIFGQVRWTPPDWLPRLGMSLSSWGRQAGNWLNAWRIASPLRFWLATSSLLAVIVTGYAGWQWYPHLPEPHYLEGTVSRPRPTRFEPDEQASTN